MQNIICGLGLAANAYNNRVQQPAKDRGGKKPPEAQRRQPTLITFEILAILDVSR